MTAPREDIAAALCELRELRSSDPCASIAVTTIKATIHTLETRWLAPGPARRHDAHDDA